MTNSQSPTDGELKTFLEFMVKQTEMLLSSAETLTAFSGIIITIAGSFMIFSLGQGQSFIAYPHIMGLFSSSIFVFLMTTSVTIMTMTGGLKSPSDLYDQELFGVHTVNLCVRAQYTLYYIRRRLKTAYIFFIIGLALLFAALILGISPLFLNPQAN